VCGFANSFQPFVSLFGASFRVAALRFIPFMQSGSCRGCGTKFKLSTRGTVLCWQVGYEACHLDQSLSRSQFSFLAFVVGLFAIVCSAINIDFVVVAVVLDVTVAAFLLSS
jgi:hypothetical protein